jgi:hypothetical protein
MGARTSSQMGLILGPMRRTLPDGPPGAKCFRFVESPRVGSLYGQQAYVRGPGQFDVLLTARAANVFESRRCSVLTNFALRRILTGLKANSGGKPHRFHRTV